MGSYECECLPGFKHIDKYNCMEIDECKTNQHACHEHSDCINTIGSYKCQCKKGYTGNGIDCFRKYIFYHGVDLLRKYLLNKWDFSKEELLVVLLWFWEDFLK